MKRKVKKEIKRTTMYLNAMGYKTTIIAPNTFLFPIEFSDIVVKEILTNILPIDYTIKFDYQELKSAGYATLTLKETTGLAALFNL